MKLRLIAILFFLAFQVYGQTTETSCTQQLRTARATYEQGRLHELPILLQECLDNGGFSKTERVEAYKLLVQTYIYLEEPVKADESMVNLLNTDHFFRPNPAVDPLEFQHLYDRFRTDPVFRYGLRVGGNINHISVIENHYVWGPGAGKGVYISHPGIQFGLIFEKDLEFNNRLKALKSLNKKLAFNPEVLFSSYSFTYNNQSPTTRDVSPVGELDNIITQQRLQANLLLQYKIEREIELDDNFTPYIAIGPAVSYLMSSSFDGTTNVGREITGSAFDISGKFNPINVDVIASAGIKLRLGDVYLTADVRYQHGLFNVANEEARWTWDDVTRQLMTYGYVNNDFKISQTMFNVGIIIPQFNPIKRFK